MIMVVTCSFGACPTRHKMSTDLLGVSRCRVCAERGFRAVPLDGRRS